MTYTHTTSISTLPFLFWQRLLNRLGLAVIIEIVVIALLFIVGFFVSEHFRTIGNTADIFEQMTGLAFVALGQTVVIITGGIDLSLDATIALTSSLLSGVVNGRADLAAPMIAAVLAIGVTIGLVNGALILSLRVHPLICAALHFDADWQYA
jgi:ribose/xylose/arabinose/galactoside ABC-type transport system permease subunit